MPTSSKKRRSKAEILKKGGTLNLTPKAVKDPKFQMSEFFDPLDLIQVKYEMLRRVHIDNVSITEAAEEYGFCRPTYYQAVSNFEKDGIEGLLPKKRGPQGPHKLQDKVLNFIEKKIVPGQPVRARELATLVQRKFGLDVHPRTIERALSEKKTRHR